VAAPTEQRSAELVAALARVRTRLAEAAAQVGRDPLAVTLVAVTKTFPASDVDILSQLGISDIGESRDQEARAKLGELDVLRLARLSDGAQSSPAPLRLARLSDGAQSSPAPLRLHFVGRLQTNKCRQVARYAYCVHTVDRRPLVTALAQAIRGAGRDRLAVFLQVSLDGDPARGGAHIGDVAELGDAIAATDELELLGVMAVAPLGAPPAQAYAQLAEVSAQLRLTHPRASAISAGMSGDYPQAVKSGATHVRIGSALLGRRDVTFS
jgi:hypothetical protein